MNLESYINTLDWGMKTKLAKYLDVSNTTVTKYGKNPDHPEKIYPSPNTAKKIESFSNKKITLEQILGTEKAQEYKNIWGVK